MIKSKLKNAKQSIKIDYKSIIIYGLLKSVFYLIIPLILIFILSIQGVLSFNQTFINNIILMGIIGVIITIIRHAPIKETLLRCGIGVFVAIYNGLYFFYIFGGFSPGNTLGNYHIETSNSIATLGLQLIAIILLLGAIFNTTYYILKFRESFLIKKKKRERGDKKTLRVAKGLKISKLSLNLFLVSFITSVGLSLINISLTLKENYSFNWNDAGTLLDYTDDSIQIISYFDLTNLGIYSVLNIHINADIFTINTSDPLKISLPDNTKIGEIRDLSYQAFLRGSINTNEEFLIDIFPQYVQGLITYDANLLLKLDFTCIYATINICFMTNVTLLWTNLLGL